MEEGELKVTIVGADEKSKKRLYSLAKTYRVDHLLDVYTWVSREKVEQIMNDTDIGLVPHRKSEHTDTTIPHKIFQYVQRLPVIVSNCTPFWIESLQIQIADWFTSQETVCHFANVSRVLPKFFA